MPVCFAWLILCAPPGVTLPAEVATPPGRIVVLKAETGGEVVRWASLAEGVDLVPFPDGKTALFCSPNPGRFTVLAWTAAGNVPSEAARVVVVVGAPAPAASEFAKELAALVGAERDAEALKRLAGAYRAAAELSDNAEVATAGQLAERVRELVRAAVPAEALVAIRKRVALESAARLSGGADAPLTPALRRAAAGLFNEVALILGGK